jgi:hypothetical protein
VLRFAVFAFAIGCGSAGDDAVTAAADSATDSESDSGSIAEVATESSIDSAVPPGRLHYPYGPLHSAMSADVIARMKAVVDASPHRKDVFAKVGASNTVNTNFLSCFAGTDVKLGTYSDLEPARQFFKKTLADASKTSFDRVSLAATVGWGAAKPIAGDPTPIQQEVSAIRPAFAIVMLGTNDTYEAGVHPFEKNLGLVVDALIKEQVAPVLTTIPPRTDTTVAAALVPEMNAIIRVVAAYKSVPLIDLEPALEPLMDKGLASDGIHLQVYTSGGAHGCWLTTEGLTEGMNQRNLLTLQSLDRLKRYVLDGAMPEPRAKSIAGSGTWMTPFVADAIPFTDHFTTKGASDEVDKYPCGPADESGPEVIYRVDLAAAQKLRIRVFVDDGVDVDLHWLDGSTAMTCTARADRILDVDAPAGSHRLVVDSFVQGGVAKAGGYRLTILPRP